MIGRFSDLSISPDRQHRTGFVIDPDHGSAELVLVTAMDKRLDSGGRGNESRRGRTVRLMSASDARRTVVATLTPQHRTDLRKPEKGYRS